MTWRNCQASTTLVTEINARFPGRDKSSDGTIGDAAHAARTSDHNPWFILNGQGIVRARDIDKDGIDPAGLAESLRQLGARRDPRLYPDGYVIFNRRITSPDFSGWHVYTGTNPHEHHLHVSFSTVPAGFDSTAPWGIATSTPTPASAPPEDDMALTDPVPDYYTANPSDRMQAGEAIAWGTAHAANARDAARAALAKATTLESKVDALLARVVSGAAPTGGSLSPADVDRIAAAVVKLLGSKTSA